jgi:hypothetical protein
MLRYLFYIYIAKTGLKRLKVIAMKKTTAAVIATFALFLAASGLIVSGSLAFGFPGATDATMDDTQVIPGNSPHVIPGNSPHVIPGNSPHSIVDVSSLVIPGNSPHGWTWTDCLSYVIPGNSPH